MSNNQFFQGQNPRYSVSVEPNHQGIYPVQSAAQDGSAGLDPKENEFRAKVKALIDSREDLKAQHKILSEKIDALIEENSMLSAELEKYKTLLAENKLVIDEMMKENQQRQAAVEFGAPSPMYAPAPPPIYTQQYQYPYSMPQQNPYNPYNPYQGRPQDGGIGDLCGHINQVLAGIYQRICALEHGNGIR